MTTPKHPCAECARLERIADILWWFAPKANKDAEADLTAHQSSCPVYQAAHSAMREGE